MTSVAINSVLSGSFGNARALTCRECGASYDLGGQHACPQCFGPLEVSYDLPPLTRETIESGPPNMWRDAPLLPVPADIALRPHTRPRRTRLIRAHALATGLATRPP